MDKRPAPTAPRGKEIEVWVYNAIALREILKESTTPTYLLAQRKSLLDSIPLSYNTVTFYNPRTKQIWTKVIGEEKRIANTLTVRTLLWKTTLFGNSEMELGPFFDRMIDDIYNEHCRYYACPSNMSTFRRRKELSGDFENANYSFPLEWYQVTEQYFQKTSHCCSIL